MVRFMRVSARAQAVVCKPLVSQHLLRLSCGGPVLQREPFETAAATRLAIHHLLFVRMRATAPNKSSDTQSIGIPTLCFTLVSERCLEMRGRNVKSTNPDAVGGRGRFCTNIECDRDPN
jgi:hypothetical protein